MANTEAKHADCSLLRQGHSLGLDFGGLGSNPLACRGQDLFWGESGVPKWQLNYCFSWNSKGKRQRDRPTPTKSRNAMGEFVVFCLLRLELTKP